MYKKFLVTSLFFLFLSFQKVYARSGCCSHHGGVCGCGCCDGTSLSATCAPYYPGCSGGGTYYIPRAAPTIPPNTNATWQYYLNSDNTVDLLIDWDRPDNKAYSITINKNAGANPGSLVDTYQSQYLFHDVKPGKWFINIKESFNSTWSEVSYWTINIPSNVNQLAIKYPTPTPIPTTYPTVKPANNKTKDSSSGDWLLPAVLAAFISIYYVSNRKKEK